jgi:RNA recognition motif-containing protein
VKFNGCPEFAGHPATFDKPVIRHFGEQERMKKIYVGNLPFSATEEQVRNLFSKHGTVQSVSLINDRETGRPRGFGFVEISDNGLAPALKALDGFELDGRALKVNEAENKPRNGGGGGGGGSRW